MAVSEIVRRCKLKKKYGITPEQFDELLKKQSARCAICGKSGSGRIGGGRLLVDHCHKTGAVRGLLCHQCNSAIGMLNDDVDVVASAFRYLSGRLNNPDGNIGAESVEAGTKPCPLVVTT